MLLLGEAQRRAGKIAEGTGTWQAAVLQIAELVRRPVSIADPILWERAAYLRPVQSGWPTPVMQQLMPAGATGAGPGQPPSTQRGLDEGWLWTSIGRWRLARNEPEGALFALKRAESLTLDARQQAELQLGQALALARLDQPAAAMAVLVRLAGTRNNPAAPPALAMLGALKLKEGSTEQALALLRRAVEQDSFNDWPGRGEAEADLGLACLMTGDEAAGLRHLHEAQRRFEVSGDMDLLAECLANESAYWKHRGNESEVHRIAAKLQQ
jgi:tetratricopeptide (TPR) repeat protein